VHAALEKKVLSENDRLAAELHLRFQREHILCLNLISSPGSGKTMLLEKTLAALPNDTPVAVLTGDIQTDNDARRLASYGFPVRQIVTGGTCHLDARMIDRHLNEMGFHGPALLFIENVGNLVCPSSYDLGEAAKIVLVSVTEGEDKPLKYPGIFLRASLMLLTKTDLLPHVEFDPALAHENARKIHPEIEYLAFSARTGEGFPGWLGWLMTACRRVTYGAVQAVTMPLIVFAGS
jgi:hydrogenase nickel incorporation protein HypB